MGFLNGLMGGPFGTIAEGVSKALGIAENISRKSQEGQLIDAGEAKGLVKGLETLNAQLADFKAAADRVDSDPDYAKRVRDDATTD